MARQPQISSFLQAKPAIIGPYDARSKRTRCEICRQRRIKCEGGFPCSNCTRKHLHCVPPVLKPASSEIFVHHTSPPSGRSSVPVGEISSCQTLVIPASMAPDLSTKLTKHFFSVFLNTHHSGGHELDTDTILSLYGNYPSLYNAIIAVAALDASRRYSFASDSERKAVKLLALESCNSSVVALKAELATENVVKSVVCLWTTFFLGFFELMYDVTGEGWIAHILHGTSKILQHRGPDSHLSGPGRSFFITVRIFEVCRAFIFNDETFLSQPEWQAMTSKLWLTDPSDWHPQEALLDLMIDCISLLHRVRIYIAKDPNIPSPPPSSDTLLPLASAGLAIQSDLQNWHADFLLWQSTFPLRDSQRSAVASLYYHTLLIYLSGIYDYTPLWHVAGIAVPSLSQAEVEIHLAAILSESEAVLGDMRLAPVGLLPPLRVAGARSTTVEQQRRILKMMAAISSRNFMVVSALREELVKLWDGRVLEEDFCR